MRDSCRGVGTANEKSVSAGRTVVPHVGRARHAARAMLAASRTREMHDRPLEHAKEAQRGRECAVGDPVTAPEAVCKPPLSSPPRRGAGPLKIDDDELRPMISRTCRRAEEVARARSEVRRRATRVSERPLDQDGSRREGDDAGDVRVGDVVRRRHVSRDPGGASPRRSALPDRWMTRRRSIRGV